MFAVNFKTSTVLRCFPDSGMNFFLKRADVRHVTEVVWLSRACFRSRWYVPWAYQRCAICYHETCAQNK